MTTYITTSHGKQRPIFNCAGTYIESITGVDGQKLNDNQARVLYTTAAIADKPVKEVWPFALTQPAFIVGPVYWLPLTCNTIPANATAFCLDVAEGSHSGFVKMVVHPPHPILAEYARTLNAPLNQFYRLASNA
jgi:hypothetical protein